jgi:hypothetical protein
MALVFRLEVASELDDRSQLDASPQRARISGPNPIEDGAGPHDGVSLCGGETCEVAKHPFMISQLEAGSPTTGEVDIDCCAQHRTTSGQGWATCPSSSRSTLA